MYFICLATGFALCVATVSGGGLLFPHMANNGDTLMRKCYICYDQVAVTGNYVVFGNPHNTVYVTDRGYVTFGSRFTEIYPYFEYLQAFDSAATLVAPLWLNQYQFANMSNLKPHHIWYRETTNPNMLAKAEKAIQDNFGWCGNFFKPTHLFIVTWQRVVSYCDWDWYYACNDYSTYSTYSTYYGKRDTESTNKTGPNPIRNETYHSNVELTEKDHYNCDREWRQNGYQLVLATDGYDTFALFNYADIQYEFCNYYGLTAINAGDGVRYWKHPDTYAAGLGAALTGGTNAGLPGRWIYKLSESQIRDPTCTTISAGP